MKIIIIILVIVVSVLIGNFAFNPDTSDYNDEEGIKEIGIEAMERKVPAGAVNAPITSNEEETDEITDTYSQEESYANPNTINIPGKFLDLGDVVISDLSGKIVLDFHAPWCPSCKVLEKNINDNLSEIPSDVTIIKVDYDTNLALREKYGVRYQHTLVQIKNTGEKINLWSGGSKLKNILDKIK